MIKLTNSDTHSCIHSLASLETCATARHVSHILGTNCHPVITHTHTYIHTHTHTHLAILGDNVSHDSSNVGDGKKSILEGRDIE